MTSRSFSLPTFYLEFHFFFFFFFFFITEPEVLIVVTKRSQQNLDSKVGYLDTLKATTHIGYNVHVPTCTMRN